MLKGVRKLESIAYFDNAATTFPKPEEVYQYTDQFYRTCGVNVGRGQHKLAAKASKLVQDTRVSLLSLFHCPNKKIVFTPTATEAINLILQGLTISDEYNIYISPFEHNAVTRVLNQLQNIYKINIIQLAVDRKSLKYDLEKIKNQFSERKPNRMIVSHASNVCGVVAPIQELSSMAKMYGAVTIVDMCQTAGLIDIDLSSTDIDFAIFAGHKTLYSPLGVAGVVSNFDIKPKPLIYGGTGVDSANQSLPETIPERYEVASPNIAAIAGLYAALGWIQKIGIQKIYNKEQQNKEKLIEILNRFSNIKIINTMKTESIGVVSCIFEGYSSDNIGQILSEQNIAVRTGLHCAPYAHQFLGTFPSGTVRFSVSYFNTDEDFEALREALEYIEINS